MRWARYATAVALVGLSLTVAAPAQAFQPSPLDPVRFPGSTLKGSAPDMSPREWNRFLKQHPELRPTTGGNWTKVGLRGAGTVTAAMFGLSIGTHVAGVFGLPTTGDFWCDLATATVSSDCGLSADPAYVPNFDVQPGMLGWVGTPVITQPFTNNWSQYTRTTTIAGVWGPEWGHSGQVEVQYSVSIPGNAERHWVCNGGGTGANISLTPLGSFPNLASTSAWWPNPCSSSSQPLPMPQTVTTVTHPTHGMAPLELKVGGELVGVWFPEGHPERPPDIEPNPETWWRTTWRCDAGAPRVEESVPFREEDTNWPSIPSARCDAGAVVTSVLIEQMTGQGVRDTLIDWELDQTGIDWNTEYPQCADGSCILDLMRIDPQTDKRLSCFSNPALCWDWFEDPNKLDKFECRYGGTVVALKECNVYRPTFPNPDTGRKPDYADPDPENPDPPVVHVPPQPNPLPPRGSPQPDTSCPPPFTWLSAINPWWHFKSFTCGLQDMFLPSGNVDFSGVNAAWRGSALGQIQTTFGDPLGFGGVLINPGGVTCGVIVDVEVPILDGQHFVVDTCTGIWQEAGGIRTVIAAAFIIAGVLGGVWVILGTVRVRVGGEGNTT